MCAHTVVATSQIASWTAQAILVGANAMKIGYVSRKHHKDSHNHFILGTQVSNASKTGLRTLASQPTNIPLTLCAFVSFHQNQKPKDFAFQVNLDQKNMWGILKVTTQDLALSLYSVHSSLSLSLAHACMQPPPHPNPPAAHYRPCSDACREAPWRHPR